MAFELKDGQGSLFKNDKTKDNQPDYTGSVMIEGRLYKLAGWIKEGRSGKFLSLKAEEKDPGGQGAPARAAQASSGFAGATVVTEDESPF